jgi:hypothetical protein
MLFSTSVDATTLWSISFSSFGALAAAFSTLLLCRKDKHLEMVNVYKDIRNFYVDTGIHRKTLK